MAHENLQLVAFNRGLISPLALARIDVKRSAFSAQTMNNWMPRALGSMMLRPGLQYKTSTSGNAAARYIPFIFRIDDTALIEFTDQTMRVLVNDAVITRPTVSTSVTNGNFTTDVSGWTDSDEVGGVSDWVTDGSGSGYMRLLGNGSAKAIRDQQVTVSGDSINIEHGVHIVIQRGPVTVRVGQTIGGTSYIADTVLRPGVHSLAVTPAASFWIRFYSASDIYAYVKSCTIEAAGSMALASPYTANDLDYIRGGPDSQSADVVFVGCNGYQQRRIERHGTRSWSFVLYQAPDGPFRSDNGTATTLAASAISGNVTITASTALFHTTQVGALYSHTSIGQTVAKSFTALGQTDSIRVTGVGVDRTQTIVLSGLSTTGNTVILERSFDNTTWTAVAGETWTADVTTSYADALDNSIVYYRLRCSVYAAGTTVATLTIPTGSITGFFRITGFTSSTSVSAEVLTHLGGTSAVTTWAEGEWSDFRGWPGAVGFYEGRLAWAGQDGIWISTTDAFDTFLEQNTDGTPIGDSGPIARHIGFGPVDVINWICPLQRLIIGGQATEFSVRSTTFDDPITPTNFNIKAASGQGSANVAPLKIDNHGAFVQRGGTRLFELAFATDVYDYTANDLTTFYPEAGGTPGTTTHIVRMAVQRQPDTRIHCIRSDGSAAVLVYDKGENIMCWLTLSTAGSFEDVVVLPSTVGTREDQVYYVTRRTINGSTVRYLEKFALETECVGGTLNKQADAFVEFTNSPPSLIVGGLNHLIGMTVICWHDGICEEDDLGDFRVYAVNASGQITLDQVATTGIVGLAYEAEWQSNWLGSVLPARKRIGDIGLMLKDTHPRGIFFGPTLNIPDMDNLPLVDEGAPVDTNAMYTSYKPEPIPFPGGFDVDSRLCLKAQAPRPVTVLAAVIAGEKNV